MKRERWKGIRIFSPLKSFKGRKQFLLRWAYWHLIFTGPQIYRVYLDSLCSRPTENSDCVKVCCTQCVETVGGKEKESGDGNGRKRSMISFFTFKLASVMTRIVCVCQDVTPSPDLC